MDTFGQLLHHYRSEADMPQNQLSRLSGVNVGTINRLERDHRLPPSPSMVCRIGRVLALSAGEIDRLLVAAGFPATERRLAAYRRWHRWAS